MPSSGVPTSRIAPSYCTTSDEVDAARRTGGDSGLRRRIGHTIGAQDPVSELQRALVGRRFWRSMPEVATVLRGHWINQTPRFRRATMTPKRAALMPPPTPKERWLATFVNTLMFDVRLSFGNKYALLVASNEWSREKEPRSRGSRKAMGRAEKCTP